MKLKEKEAEKDTENSIIKRLSGLVCFLAEQERRFAACG